MQNFQFQWKLLLLINICQSLQPFIDTDLDFASSPIDIANLIVVDSNIVFNFLTFLDQSEDQSSHEMNGIREYVKDFESTLLKDLQLDTDIFKMLYNRSIIDLNGLGLDASKHPFKIYRTIRRFVKLLPILINSTLDAGMVQGIEELKTRFQFPKELDLETSISNVLRLNQIFKLPFTDFLEGKVGKIQTKCGLTSENLEEIGYVALKNQLYSQAVDAFAIALWNGVKKWEDKANFANTVGKVRLNEILQSLQNAIKQHDDKLEGTIEIEDVQDNSGPSFFDDLLYNMSHNNFKFRIPVKLETVIPHSSYDEDDIRLHVIKNGYTFEKLCRGEELRSPEETKALKCHLFSKNHPEFILKPLKVEIQHEDPLIVQYHDILNDQEVQQYKDEVKGEMRMSRTLREKVETSKHRTSSNAWIEDYINGKFVQLLHKFGRILNVETRKATGTENMQIAAYSPGGHYSPHTDAVFEEQVIKILDPSEFLRGDRIITMMLYLSDVEEGGATVFPYLKTVVQPKKGSAVVWYNLQPDGEIDRRTLHGGCSVVYGVKWIANKWIRNDDQMFLKRCPASKPTPKSWTL